MESSFFLVDVGSGGRQPHKEAELLAPIHGTLKSAIALIGRVGETPQSSCHLEHAHDMWYHWEGGAHGCNEHP